jgi:hypothetical protein
MQPMLKTRNSLRNEGRPAVYFASMIKERNSENEEKIFSNIYSFNNHGI